MGGGLRAERRRRRARQSRACRLAGTAGIELTLDDGTTLTSELDLPPGAPQRPPSQADLAAKVADCAGELGFDVLALDRAAAPEFLRELQPVTRSASPG